MTKSGVSTKFGSTARKLSTVRGSAMINRNEISNDSYAYDSEGSEESNFGLDTLPLDVVEQMYEVVKGQETRFVRALRRQIDERNGEKK